LIGRPRRAAVPSRSSSVTLTVIQRSPSAVSVCTNRPKSFAAATSASTASELDVGVTQRDQAVPVHFEGDDLERVHRVVHGHAALHRVLLVLGSQPVQRNSLPTAFGSPESHSSL
jgi:hypothetical protein